MKHFIDINNFKKKEIDEIIALAKKIKKNPKKYSSSCRDKTLGFEDNVLVLIDAFDENLYLSSRNITNALVVEAKYADPVSLVHFSKVIATPGAVKQLEEMFA